MTTAQIHHTTAERTPVRADAVQAAVASVDDPEYPGVSIVDLGLLEHVDIRGNVVEIGLVPTFSGCPALKMIAADVEGVVAAVAGVESVTVTFLQTPAWTPSRITPAGHTALSDLFTVAVQLPSTTPRCPRCGAHTEEQSLFGPTRCRSIHRCPGCGEVVEVIR